MRIGQKYGDAGFGHNVTKYLDTPNMQNRLGEVMTGRNADKLNDIAGIEAEMAKTRNRVMGGSRTDENQQLQMDFTLMQRLGRQLSQGQVLGAAGDAIASTLRSVYRFRETDARLLARDLFATDPAQRTATIQRLEQAYGTRQARAAISDAVQLAQRAAARLAVPSAVEYLNAPAQPQAVNALGTTASKIAKERQPYL